MSTVRIVALLVAVSLAVVAPPAARSLAASDEIVVAVQSYIQRFDPTALLTFMEYVNFGLLFDGLLNLGPNGLEPGLATHWQIGANGLTVDFTLRRGVRFHNGDPLTADDVKFTFERSAAPDSTHGYRKSFQEALARVEVLAPDRVRFHLKKPWPTLLTSARNGIQPIVPRAYYERVGPRGFQNQPVGTGPYRFAGMALGESTRFTLNPDYWGPPPAAKAVTVRLVAEHLTRLAMLVRGEADVIDGAVGPVLDRVRQSPSLRLVTAPNAGSSFLMFNRRTNPEFKDRRVRLAVAHAIDRKGIAETMLGGICEPADGPFTPSTFGYVPGLRTIPYDPDRARALLREAAVALAQPINFVIHTTPFQSLPGADRVLEAVAGQLEALGLRLGRQPLDTGAFVTALRGHTIAGISYGAFTVPDDGGLMMASYFYSGGTFWNDIKVPEYDALFERQLNEGQSERRLALLQQWARLENERVEAVPLFWCGSSFATGPKVGEWRSAMGQAAPMNLHRLKLATR